MSRNYHLSNGAKLTISFVVFLSASAIRVTAQTSITTYHYDNNRTGWNRSETVLTPANVGQNTFGLLQTVTLDDQADAQPLVVPGVMITAGTYQGTTHDVVYVATENNSVYAIDVHSGTVLLSPNFGTPVPQSSLPGNCNNNGPNVGINSTPVIDLSSNTLYVMIYTQGPAGPAYRLHALGLGSLTDEVTPQLVSASHVLSDGTTFNFQAKYQRQRPGLLLANGNIYAGFGSFCDNSVNLSRGWLLGWTAGSLAPFPSNQLNDQQATSPNSFFLSSIWMSGYGPAADDDGNILFVTGNSDSSGTTYDGVTNIQESVVKVSSTLTTVEGLFTPDNQASLDEKDVDFGSGGVLVLPDQPGPTAHLAVAAGKYGEMYFMNEDNLGGYSSTQNNVLGTYNVGACWCGQSYYVDPTDGLGRVVSSGGNTVMVWRVQTSPTVALTKVTNAAVLGGSLQDPGFFTSISSNGTASPIIWALSRPTTNNNGAPISLYAFNPDSGGTTMTQLFQATAGAWPNTTGNANLVPVVANGLVFVASNKQLQIFGLTGTPAAAPTFSPNGGTFSASTPVTISDTTTGATISYCFDTTNTCTPSTTGTTYTVTSTGYLRAQATASGYITSAVASTTYTISVATTGTATFVALDTTTQGSWQGVYGSSGYNVISGTVAYPSFVTVTPSGTSTTTWASSTTDVRALYTSATSTNRVAASWHNTSSFLIDLVFNDGQQHQVALYCLDWDTTKRAETVAVQDANRVLLNSQNMTNFHNGEYLVWQVSGHVQILVTTKTTSANAVVSGLFFYTTAPVGSYTLTGPSGGALNTASSNFTVTPNGTYNGTITVTPSGGGLSAPTVLTFSSAASQTFTITPTAVGPVTLAPSNSGTLTNPAALTYATPPGGPTIGTATAGSGQATVTFTAPASTGGSAITSYTATCGSQSVSGTASPITVTGLSNGTSYTCTVTASNAIGVSAPSAASNSVTPSSAGTTTGTATFVDLDTTTQGNWQGVYGSNGYNVINGTVAYPSFVTVTPSGTSSATWASSTTDVRALYTSATSTTRIAATWYNTTSFLIDLVFNDGQQHQVALYCLDWDTTKRAETVAVQDANGVLLNSQNMTNFHNGEYLVWQVSGHVQILVTTKTTSANAVVSGLFFK